MKPLEKAKKFCQDYEIDIPILMAPMAGACPPELAAAISNAGGIGSCGALLMTPKQIISWVSDFKFKSNGSFMLNNWIPGPEPERNARHEAALRSFLTKFGPEVSAEAADTKPISFSKQCDAMLSGRPQVISSIMGLYPSTFVKQMKQVGTKWFATVTSVSEALMAEQAGADALVVQGSEAGGHRGNFLSDYNQSAGLVALVPAVCDAVSIPVIATGGIADSRGVSAALMLGASAVQIGTGFLRTPEASISPAWADAIKKTRPEDTKITTSFSGKPGRAIENKYMIEAHNNSNPTPAPYPIQGSLTKEMCDQAKKSNNIDHMQAWAGQAACLARSEAAHELVLKIWAEAEVFFGKP